MVFCALGGLVLKDLIILYTVCMQYSVPVRLRMVFLAKLTEKFSHNIQNSS